MLLLVASDATQLLLDGKFIEVPAELGEEIVSFLGRKLC